MKGWQFRDGRKNVSKHKALIYFVKEMIFRAINSEDKMSFSFFFVFVFFFFSFLPSQVNLVDEKNRVY